MKYYDPYLLGIIGIILTLSVIVSGDAVLGALPDAGKWEALIALFLLLFPQGRIFVRMGDLKKMGRSWWTRFIHFVTSEVMVLAAIIIYTLANAK